MKTFEKKNVKWALKIETNILSREKYIGDNNTVFTKSQYSFVYITIGSSSFKYKMKFLDQYEERNLIGLLWWW